MAVRDAARVPGIVVRAPKIVTTGTRVVVRGRIPTSRTGVGARRKALLHHRSAGARPWTIGSTGRTTRRGMFVLSFSAPHQVGPISLRFTAPRVGRIEAVRRTMTVSVVAPAVVPTSTATPTVGPTTTGPQGDPNDWSYIGSGDSLRWDGCETITWSYDASEQPYPEAESDTTTAFAMIADRTGHTFLRMAVGEAVLPVNWSTPEQDPRLAGNVVALGGARSQRIDPAVNSGTQRAIVSGFVILDASHTSIPGGFDRQGWGQIITHEIGHTVGLGHAAGREQIMASMSTTSNITFGAGDLAGLTQVGTGKGCLDVPVYTRADPGAEPRASTISWTE